MPPESPLNARTRALHDSALVIDACAPILRNGENIDLWRDGGATCALATVALHDDGPASTMRAIGNIARTLRTRDDAVLAGTADEILAAKRANKLAIVLMFQSSSALGRELHMVETFFKLGVRSMNLAYNQAEHAADGCMEERNAGLSLFGRQVVAEMNRVGMLLDLSHTGYRATMEAMEASTAPVAFTHSNAHALYNHPRNITAEQIKACVATGGVIGVNGHPIFIKAGTAAPSVDDYLAHVDYMVDTAGIDHVGLGLDFSQAPGTQISAERYKAMLAEEVWTPKTLPPPPWTYPFRDASLLPRLTDALLARGWSDADVKKLLGENFLRLFRAVWPA